MFHPVFCPGKRWQTAKPEILKTGNTTYHCPAVFNIQSFQWLIYYTVHKTRKACFSERDFDQRLRSHFNRVIFDCWHRSFLFCLLSLLLFLTAYAFPIKSSDFRLSWELWVKCCMPREKFLWYFQYLLTHSR